MLRRSDQISTMNFDVELPRYDITSAYDFLIPNIVITEARDINVLSLFSSLFRLSLVCITTYQKI